MGGVVRRCVAPFCDDGGCIQVVCGFRPLCEFFVFRLDSVFPLILSGVIGSVCAWWYVGVLFEFGGSWVCAHVLAIMMYRARLGRFHGTGLLFNKVFAG